MSKRTTQRHEVLEFIRTVSRGVTCDEVEMALDLPHQSASARITELHSMGLVYFHADDRRTTRTGRTARVYVATRQVTDGGVP